jgi:hypothetical protein
LYIPNSSGKESFDFTDKDYKSENSLLLWKQFLQKHLKILMTGGKRTKRIKRTKRTKRTKRIKRTKRTKRTRGYKRK